MTVISTDSNIQAHYSTSSKVVHNPKTVVNAPANLPTTHLFNDRDATNKFQAINQDIYRESKSEESKPAKTFFTVFAITVAVILGFKAIKNLFKKS